MRQSEKAPARGGYLLDLEHRGLLMSGKDFSSGRKKERRRAG